MVCWYQWLMPVILATLKAEIRRIAVRSQPGQIVHETLSQNNLTQKGLVERQLSVILICISFMAKDDEQWGDFCKSSACHSWLFVDCVLVGCLCKFLRCCGPRVGFPAVDTTKSAILMVPPWE
jgi:hypothetical protein